MKLEPQIPAVGITQTHAWGKSKMYAIRCECGNTDDEIEFIVEADKYNVTVTTWTTQKTVYWDRPIDLQIAYKIENSFLSSATYEVLSFLNGFHHRLKMSWNLWFNGYLKYQQSTIMSTQQALNYAEALKSAVEDCQEFRKQDKECQ